MKNEKWYSRFATSLILVGYATWVHKFCSASASGLSSVPALDMLVVTAIGITGHLFVSRIWVARCRMKGGEPLVGHKKKVAWFENNLRGAAYLVIWMNPYKLGKDVQGEPIVDDQMPSTAINAYQETYSVARVVAYASFLSVAYWMASQTQFFFVSPDTGAPCFLRALPGLVMIGGANTVALILVTRLFLGNNFLTSNRKV